MFGRTARDPEKTVGPRSGGDGGEGGRKGGSGGNAVIHRGPICTLGAGRLLVAAKVSGPRAGEFRDQGTSRGTRLG